MKKLVTMILLATFIGSPAYSNEVKDQVSNRWLKVSIDGPFALFGVFLPKVEVKMSDSLSLIANVGYLDPRVSIDPNINSFKFGSDGLVGLKFGVGARWYPLRGAMDGLYMQNIIDLDLLWTYSGNAITYQSANIGPIVAYFSDTFHIGYSWVTDFGLFFDAALGITVWAPIKGIPTDVIKLSFYPTSQSEGMNRFETRLGVGWAF